ncbi:MAG: GNAT family N-acetyltransferase [SAR324 cluster bacterium]|nr:GNAT family N-acetyltransferase [SAR324 cluster bacterium]
MEDSRNGFLITTERSRMDIVAIHGFLTESYWARGIPLAVVEKSMQNSLCFGVFEGQTQVGFARVITDYATFGYLGDVFILQSHQGLGLGKWLLDCVMAHPGLQGLRRWNLATYDAHRLYARYGFSALAKAEYYMEINVPDPYPQDQG